MTTIAWDGTTLAGDTVAIVGDNLKIRVSKIFRLSDGRLYGGAGDRQDALAVKDWLNEGGDKPKLNEHCTGMLILATGVCLRLEDALVPMPILEPFHAIGSGRDYALAAMALGKTAAEAVALAMQFDPWTGGEVETLSLPLVKPTELENFMLTPAELKDLNAGRHQAGMLSWDERGTPYAPR